MKNILGLATAVLILLHGCTDAPNPEKGEGGTNQAEIVATHAPDFKHYPAGPARKQAFFEYFAPLIHQANQSIQTKRERLKTLIDQNSLSEKDQAWLKTQAELFGQEVSDRFDPSHSENQKALLKRIDTIPTSLALAQAANESAWGTSRFARKAHNYFGQWCYQPGCGLVPEQRISGADHEVRAFDHPYESVKSYLHNLNSHSAYADLRRIRAQLRSTNQPVTGVALAEGLLQYSERGEAYVEELRSMIRYNELSRFNLNFANGKD